MQLVHLMIVHASDLIILLHFTLWYLYSVFVLHTNLCFRSWTSFNFGWSIPDVHSVLPSFSV